MKLSVTLLISIATCGIAQAQNRATYQQESPLKPNFSPLAWTKEAFTGDDREFKFMRRSLEAGQQVLLTNIVRNEKSTLANSQLSPDSLFKMGTSAYLLVGKFRKPEYRNDLNMVLHAMDKAKSPKTYSYTRLHFLLAATFSRVGERFLIDLGLRLSVYDKNDYDVRYYTAKLLQPDVRPTDKQLGLKLCREMASIDSNRLSLQSIQASIYFRAWLKLRKQDDKREALGAYKKYILLAPKNDPFVPQAQLLITYINSH